MMPGAESSIITFSGYHSYLIYSFGSRGEKRDERSAAAVRPSTFASGSFPLVMRLPCVCERSAMAWIFDKSGSKFRAD